MVDQSLSLGGKGGIGRKQQNVERATCSCTPASDGPARVQELEVMAGDPIPTQDDVKARSQVEEEHVEGLAQRRQASEHQKDLYR